MINNGRKIEKTTRENREERLKKIDRCGLQIKMILDLNGLWAHDKPNFYSNLRWFIIVMVFSFEIMGDIGFVIYHRDNFTVLLSGFGIGLSLACVILKGFCFKVYRENLIKIFSLLSKMVENQMAAKNKVWEIMIQPMAYFSNVVYRVIFCCGFSMLVVMLSRPTLSMLISHMKGNVIYSRFYPTVYYWTITPGSWTWIGHFTIDVICSWFVVSIGVTTDNIFSYIISKIIAHFRTLNYEIENLQSHKIEITKIKKLYMRHQELNTVCYLLGELAGPFVFVIVLSTAIMLCTTIFQISQMDEITLSKISWPLVYTLYKLLQIFIYAWGGELIKMESEKFRDAVYFSAWIDTKNYKLASHSVRMMMHQRPIILKACQIKPITAELFTGLINTTLSYFFLLQTINEKS